MATRTVSGVQLKVTLSGNLVLTLDDDSVSTAPISASISRSIASGVSSGRANRYWPWKSKTLNAGASQVIDLYDFAGLDIGSGTGRDQLGQEMSPHEEVVTIIIVNENTLTAGGYLEIEPDATNGWTPIGTHTVATGGALGGQGVLVKSQTIEAGFDITDGASHRIKLTAVTNSVTYSVYVLGRHDDEESSSSSSSSSSASSVSSVSSSSSTSSYSSSSSSSSSTSSSSSSSISSSQSASSSSSSVSTSSFSTSSTSSSSQSSESSSSWSSTSISTSSSSPSSESSSSQSWSSSSWSS